VNRRVNAVLFLVVATVVNILLLFFYFLVFQGVVGLFLPARDGWLAIAVWVVLLLLALASGWFTYRWAYRILRERVDLERYFDLDLFKGLF
jgi:hypothetical protein